MSQRSAEHFITSQFKAWGEKEKEKPQAPPLPLITLSREHGAGGGSLARALGERLRLTVWDRELMAAVAERTGAEERFLASLDERRRGAIRDMIDGAILGGPYMKSEYLQALMSVVHTIASHGGAIIVGRGAHYILPAEDCFRVRLVRPLEERVAQVATAQNLPERDARARITRRDQERVEYLRQHFKRDGTDPADYDLVLNSGVFALPSLVELVKTSYRMKFGREPTVTVS
jgi:hypothetical protein